MKEIEEAVRMTKLGQMLVDTGKTEGESLFAALTEKLLKASRTDDLLKATEDSAFRETLYHEYGLKTD